MPLQPSPPLFFVFFSVHLRLTEHKDAFSFEGTFGNARHGPHHIRLQLPRTTTTSARFLHPPPTVNRRAHFNSFFFSFFFFLQHVTGKAVPYFHSTLISRVWISSPPFYCAVLSLLLFACTGEVRRGRGFAGCAHALNRNKKKQT